MLSKCALRSVAALVLLPLWIWGQGGSSSLKTVPLPRWVDMVSAGETSGDSTNQDSGGQRLLLFDTQVNVAQAETMVHVVKEITSAAGVQSGANLQFSWDPSYQELLLHQITLQRGTTRTDRLELSKFKVIQQETDLDEQIYNGSLSAVLFLEDVRVGDRIEYAYTVRGQNPSLRGRFATSLLLSLDSPLDYRRIRVLCPAERPLTVRMRGVNGPTQMHERAGTREYLWEFRHVPAVIDEDEVPGWYPVFAWLQLSEFRDWSEVANWAAGVMEYTNAAEPELQAEAARLKGATPEQTVRQALDFVQNNIRYLGIEFGPNSYRPTEPGIVLKRRFGDCKDKAVLLCTLLRELGYEAYPVLVGTTYRHTLPELLPAPQDFDHAIVRATVGLNTYWVDPTRSYQRSPLSQRYLPNYAFGLVARRGETGLTAIPFSRVGAPETLTHETFKVGGQKAPTELSVATTFNGLDAESMRTLLTSEGRERVSKSYLNDYAQRYPGAAVSAPMEVQDATDADRLTLTHHFTITNFWVLAEDKEQYTCEFYPLSIHNWITKPDTAVRTLPMGVSYPRRRFLQTTIELPREFKLSNSTNRIAGPAAELRVRRSFRGRTVDLEYDYESLTNCVPVALVPEHLRSLGQMEDVIGYSLNWQNLEGAHTGNQFNWPIFLLALVYAVSFCAGATYVCRRLMRKSAAWPAPEFSPEAHRLQGLGGWLVLVGFALIVGPIRLLRNTPDFISNFSLGNWHILTSSGSMAYHPLWAPVLTIELLAQISLLIMGLFALGLFFQKRRIFPYWYIAFMVGNACFLVGDAVSVAVIKPSTSAGAGVSATVFGALLGCCVWIPYMLQSRRVKVTFVK